MKTALSIIILLLPVVQTVANGEARFWNALNEGDYSEASRIEEVRSDYFYQKAYLGVYMQSETLQSEAINALVDLAEFDLVFDIGNYLVNEPSF
ncbi:MAG: hypothetical protein AAFO69_20505 [Bacteroidota bacterium]